MGTMRPVRTDIDRAPGRIRTADHLVRSSQGQKIGNFRLLQVVDS
jgi:hypothetical protein